MCESYEIAVFALMAFAVFCLVMGWVSDAD